MLVAHVLVNPGDGGELLLAAGDGAGKDESAAVQGGKVLLELKLVFADFLARRASKAHLTPRNEVGRWRG